MSLTSKDIRLAYAALHNVTSIAEFEKYDLMNAKAYPAEWLDLTIAEFMVKAGFVVAEEKVVPSEVVCYPVESTGQAKPVIKGAKAQEAPKRKYSKQAK